jgi:hypothetical protein
MADEGLLNKAPVRRRNELVMMLVDTRVGSGQVLRRTRRAVSIKGVQGGSASSGIGLKVFSIRS